ncbi:hypothetical protein KNE206_31490 [Kitasatospora sp. NE20-6]
MVEVVEGREVGVREADRSGGDVGREVVEAPCARYRQDVRPAVERPREAFLARPAPAWPAVAAIA